MTELIGEGKAVVGWRILVIRLLAHSIREVLDIVAVFVPANLLFFRLALGVDRNQHPIIKKTVRLSVVDDRKLDRVSSSSVLDSEIEPLSVAQCVYVILHEKVVLLIADF